MATTKHYVAGAFTLLALVALILLLTPVRYEQPSALQNATLLPAPRTVKDFALVDHQGATLDLSALTGRWTLLFFGFARCPDICPLTLQQLAAARSTLRQQNVTPLPDILFISVDPERDSQEVLAAYVAHFGDGVRGATAEPAQLSQITSDLGVFFRREPGPADSYQVSHSAAVLLLNPRGELHAILSAPHDSAALVHDLPILMQTI